MPIQILDNFEVNVAKPIDNRFVVGSQSFYQNKEQIPYRYPGLRIWDLNDNFPYIWTGATWSNENQSGTVVGSGDPGRLPKFIGSGTTSNITNSLIFDNGINVGIGTTSPIDKLHVVGNIRSGNFIGGGSQLTALNATQITSGNLNLARITAGTNGQVMVRGTSHAEFVDQSTLTVGTSNNVTISNDNSSTTDQHLSFVNGTSGSLGLKVTSDKLTFQPSNGRLTVQGSLRIGTGTGTNKATIQYTTNTARTLTIPNVDGNKTFAFIDQAQTFIAAQIMNSTLTVNGVTTINNTATVNNNLTVNISSTQRLRVSGSVVTFGPDSLGSPRIRTGNNISPTEPSFTWWGNDQLGIYRPSTDVMGFVSGGVERMRITNTEVEVKVGLKVRYMSSQTRLPANANTVSTMTFNHNLGYIPIVNWTVNGGNTTLTGSEPWGLVMTSITTTTVTFYVGTNGGSNQTTVTVYCW